MKEIPNVQFTEADSTVSLLKFALQSVPPGGFDFNEARARNRILDAAESVKQGDIIKLEDADYTKAVEVVKAARWGGAPKHLIQFAEQFGL